MTFRDSLKTLRKSRIINDVLNNQKVRPENYSYGASLNALLEDVVCTSERRKLMRLWFLQLSPNSGYMRLPVNRTWCWNTKDSDIKYLLSVGFIKIGRFNKGYSKISENSKRRKSGAFRTYLVLNKEV